MDIGREVRKICNENYSVQYFLKEQGEISRCTSPKYGKIFSTDIDNKGRIYIPKELPGGDILDEKQFSYFHGILALSAFGNIIYFHPTDEENEIVCKEIEEGEEPYEIYDPLLSTETGFKDRMDTKVIIEVLPQIIRENPLDYQCSIRAQINFKPDCIRTEMRFTHKKRKDDHDMARLFAWEKENKGEVDITQLWWEGMFKDDQDKECRRYRLNIPKRFRDFCEINKYPYRIVLFNTEDEMEIWNLQRWKELVGKRIWLSEEGKFILKMGENKTQNISSKNNQIINIILSDRKTNEIDELANKETY